MLGTSSDSISGAERRSAPTKWSTRRRRSLRYRCSVSISSVATTCSRLERAGVEPAAPEELARVVGVIASKVARRVTLADEPEAPDTDGLVAAALRDFAEGDDEVPDTRCVDCLGLAIDLAQVGTRDVCRARHATAVRRCVTKVIHSMAPQIGFCGMNADRADLERLYHAVQMEDPERMWAEIDAWHAAAGAFASLAFLEVLFLLTNAELSEDRHVLRLAVEAAEAAAAEEDGGAPPPLTTSSTASGFATTRARACSSS